LVGETSVIVTGEDGRTPIVALGIDVGVGVESQAAATNITEMRTISLRIFPPTLLA
jgi:hypothetical protein